MKIKDIIYTIFKGLAILVLLVVGALLFNGIVYVIIYLDIGWIFGVIAILVLAWVLGKI